MCTFTNGIPEDLKPKKEENVVYDITYRAIQHSDLTKYDFVPTNIEKPGRKKFWRIRGYYGVSLFDDLDKLKGKVESIPSLEKTTVGFAVGHTYIGKGISTIANDHHINYYLYDWENNNPYVDFKKI